MIHLGGLFEVSLFLVDFSQGGIDLLISLTCLYSRIEYIYDLIFRTFLSFHRCFGFLGQNQVSIFFVKPFDGRVMFQGSTICSKGPIRILFVIKHVTQITLSFCILRFKPYILCKMNNCIIFLSHLQSDLIQVVWDFRIFWQKRGKLFIHSKSRFIITCGLKVFGITKSGDSVFLISGGNCFIDLCQFIRFSGFLKTQSQLFQNIQI